MLIAFPRVLILMKFGFKSKDFFSIDQEKYGHENALAFWGTK